MLDYSESKYVQHDLQRSRIKKDEMNVQSDLSVLMDTFTNLITLSDLVCLSTEKKATSEME